MFNKKSKSKSNVQLGSKESLEGSAGNLVGIMTIATFQAGDLELQNSITTNKNLKISAGVVQSAFKKHMCFFVLFFHTRGFFFL